MIVIVMRARTVATRCPFVAHLLTRLRLFRTQQIFHKSGVMAKTVFQVRAKVQAGGNGARNLCLERTGSVLGHAMIAEGPLAVAPCNAAEPLQLWHLGNRGDDGECCKGLRGYDSDQCVRDRGGNSEPDTGVCGIDGSDESQRAQLQGDGKIALRGNRCLGIAGGELVARACSATGTTWEKVNEKTSLERSIYDKEIAGAV